MLRSTGYSQEVAGIADGEVFGPAQACRRFGEQVLRPGSVRIADLEALGHGVKLIRLFVINRVGGVGDRKSANLRYTICRYDEEG